jgi:hypothetical protein
MIAISLLALLLALFAVHVVHALILTKDVVVRDDANNIQALTAHGAAEGAKLGTSVSGAGDINNDTYADVVVGAPEESPNDRDKAGAVYCFFGNFSGSPTLNTASFNSSDSVGFLIQGAVAGDKLGTSISRAGDVNGDGYDDLILGAPALFSPTSEVGRAYVIFGFAAGFTTMDLLTFTSSDTTGYIMQGAATGDIFGWCVSGAGMY